MGSTVYDRHQAVVFKSIETIYTPTTVLAQKLMLQCVSQSQRIIMYRQSNRISIWLLIGALLASCVQIAHAVFEDQAGVLDWHHAWIGTPEIATERNGLIYTATSRNVIAALNASTGEIEWRQLLETPVSGFKLNDEALFTITDEKLPLLQVWDSSSGKLLWQDRKVDDLSKDAVIVDAVFLSTGDVAILTSSGSVVIRTKAGGQHWRWVPELSSSTNPVSLAEVDGHVYVINEHKGVLSNSLEVHKLDAAHGIVQNEYKLSASPKDLHQVKVIDGHLVWIEKNHIKTNALGSSEISTVSIDSFEAFHSKAIISDSYTITILDQTSDEFLLTGQFIKDEQVYHVATVLRVDGNAVKLALNLGTSVYPHAVSVRGNTIAALQRQSKHSLTVLLKHTKSDAETAKSIIEHSSDRTGDVQYFSLLSTVPLHTLIAYDDGSIRMYHGSDLAWSREESLAYITDSEFVDLPEEKLWSQMADETSEVPEQHSPLQRYIHRLQSDVAKLPELPQWLLTRFSGVMEALQKKRELAPVYLAQQSLNDTTTPTMIYRDNFGLRKLIVSVTSTGKIVAQDTQNQGKLIWAKYYPNVQFEQIISVRAATVKMPPLIVAIGRNIDQGTMVLYRLNALDGDEFYTEDPSIAEYFDPFLETPTIATKIFALPIQEPDERTQILALYDAGTTRVFIYPDTEGARSAFKEFLPSFYFSMVNKDSTAVKGYQVVEGYRGSLTAQAVWNFDAPKGSHLVALGSRSPHEKVASLGRVLGNRNVLYKYLNPNLFAVAIADPQAQTMTITLLDGVKGSVLYQVTHEDVDTVNHDVHIGTSENWIVYHYWSNGAVRGSAKAYQVSVLELYEGSDENERIDSKSLSGYDNQKPHIRADTFVFPYGVRTLGITDTRNGVSTREVLFGLNNNQIFGVSRRLLDTRRPREKPNKEHQEEGLIPYGPIPDERKMFLSYSLEVLGMESIITAPALLESTSLVFAYGLDTFFTYRAPSRQFDVLSEEFNKSQLLLTIVALVVAILVTGPMVRRKRVNTLWK